MTDYEALKDYGFTPAKALEITIDAKRESLWARYVIELARRAIDGRD